VIVDLRPGGSLTVVRQNLETSEQDAVALRGQDVRLTWRPENAAEIQEDHP
jgi:hypothetical protein